MVYLPKTRKCLGQLEIPMAVHVGLDERVEDVDAGKRLATLVGKADACRAQDRAVIRRRGRRTRPQRIIRCGSGFIRDPEKLKEQRLLHEGELVA